MRRWLLVCLALLLVIGCSPLLSEEDARAEYAEVDALLARGEVTPQQAEWRREDIARMEEFSAFDVGSIEAIIGIILASLGLNFGAVRMTRGPSKPIPVSAVPAFQASAARHDGPAARGTQA